MQFSLRLREIVEVWVMAVGRFSCFRLWSNGVPCFQEFALFLNNGGSAR
uniref:Uncharacterized protein n=1 Tax=Salmonella typhimurium TaxID=90371 RepID=A0A0D3RJP9_SALTM|nr:hypothetical protein [Salmonella enterica subsp. enterica serovar Typhimurium]